MAMTIRVVQPLEARGIARVNASGQAGMLGDESDERLRLAVLRLAANRLCPVTRAVLVGATMTSLRGLVPSEICSPIDLDADIDSLIASGDLVLGNDVAAGRPRTLVYQAPPMFVRRSGGTVFVIGGLPELPNPLSSITHSRGPFRELVPAPIDQDLIDAGFGAYPLDVWMESPGVLPASELFRKLDTLLDQAGNAGELLELEVVDPAADPGFYRGRWSTPRGKTGRFLARRKRKWGGRAWGYAEVVEGEAAKFRTFPSIDGRFRACDETWWAICAMDALAGRPQPIEVSWHEDTTSLAFGSPLPMWAERRLLSVGMIAETRPPGALVAYDVRAVDAQQEIDFLSEQLWMEPRSQLGTS